VLINSWFYVERSEHRAVKATINPYETPYAEKQSFYADYIIEECLR